MERIEYEAMAAVEPFHWWYGGMRCIAKALINQVYAGRSDLNVLDAGCGTGGNLAWLRQYGRVAGIDQAQEAFLLGKPRLSGCAVRGSVLALPFQSAQFDLVTAFEVVYHWGVPDEVVALREFHRVLRPYGHVVIRVPAFELFRGKHDRNVHARKRFVISEMSDSLDRAGFQMVQATYVNTLMLPIAMVQRIVERTFDTGREGSDLEPVPATINELLRWPLAAEAAWVGRGLTFPVGLSLLCIARRNG